MDHFEDTNHHGFLLLEAEEQLVDPVLLMPRDLKEVLEIEDGKI
jgi:hypothetical protein